jgi:four helix bundle protein
MNQNELRQRTKMFALNVIKLVESLPYSVSSAVISKQVVRSGTSVGANYRSACRSKSDRDFLNKMIIVEEEADESAYWLELLLESGMIPPEKTIALQREASELTAIFTASGQTIRRRLNNK